MVSVTNLSKTDQPEKLGNQQRNQLLKISQILHKNFLLDFIPSKACIQPLIPRHFLNQHIKIRPRLVALTWLSKKRIVKCDIQPRSRTITANFAKPKLNPFLVPSVINYLPLRDSGNWHRFLFLIISSSFLLGKLQRQNISQRLKSYKGLKFKSDAHRNKTIIMNNDKDHNL